MIAPPSARLFAELKEFTKSPEGRFAVMADVVRRIDREQIAGDIVECGVWAGGNIILARKLSPHRVCWLYDTFEGMTQPEYVDVTRGGMKASSVYGGGVRKDAVSVEEVRANLDRCNVLDDSYLRFVKGPVEETLIDPVNIPERIALLRLDTDWHASTKASLDALYPKLVPGGILIVDDYGHWMGARKAVDDYFGDAPPVMNEIDYSAVIIVKPK